MRGNRQNRKFPFRIPEKKLHWKDFLLLPGWIRMLAISTVTLLLLTAVFFMAGNYLYSPQKVARDYYEAMLAGDWNQMYDCCRFPEGQFLSRINFVNAMSYGTSGEKNTPEIKNYRMRRKETDESSGVSTYTVSYTLQGVSESQNSTVKIARGSRIMGPFYEWYIVPEDLYVENVEIAVPEDADFYLDCTRILDQYESEDSDASTGNGEKVYEIPCLFLGYHTARIHEKERTDYREIFYVKNNGHLEFLPELKLNDSTGKEIADLLEDAVQDFCDAGMKKESFSKIRSCFSSDAQVQKKAEETFEEFCQGVADENNTGLANLTITNIDTVVSNTDGQMKAEVTFSYTAERVEKRLFFFYRTVTESGTKKLELQIGSSGGEWKIESWN